MLPLRTVLAGSLLTVTTAAAAQVSPLSTATPADSTVFALKSPTSARLIGILPGAGHMYAGEVGRGFLYLGGTLGILVTGGLIGVRDCMDVMIGNLFSSEQADCGPSPAVVASLIAAGGLWAWSLVDAGRAARRTNAKRAPGASLLIEPTRIPVAFGDDRTAVRLGVRISTW